MIGIDYLRWHRARVARAWSDTDPGSWARRGIYALGLFAVGSVFFLFDKGPGAVADEFSVFISYGGKAGTALFAVVFLVNWLLAPSRIYKDQREALRPSESDRAFRARSELLRASLNMQLLAQLSWVEGFPTKHLQSMADDTLLVVGAVLGDVEQLHLVAQYGWLPMGGKEARSRVLLEFAKTYGDRARNLRPEEIDPSFR